MKLTKHLSVAGQQLQIIADDVVLNIRRPGTANFTVQADVPLRGIVQYAAGYNPQQLQPWFIGYVQQSITLDNNQQRLICRELTAILEKPLFLNLRQVTLAEVLHAISEKMNLSFVVGVGDYAEHTTACFYNVGTGYHALDSLGPVFGIDQFIWQQQADGSIYVGSWHHSFWANKSPAVAQQWFTEFAQGPRANIPAIPNLRPGVLLKDLGYLQTVRFHGSEMALTWGHTI